MLLARKYPLHIYRNSFNNNRHIPTIMQGCLFSGRYTYKYRLFLSMLHKISLMSFRLQMPFGENIADDDTNAKAQNNNNIEISKILKD